MPVSAAAGTVIGSAFAETSFHGDAVADVAALTAILPSERADRQERTVESPLEQYVFDLQSAAASSPPDILVPDDSPAAGRWIRLVPGGGVPASHAASHLENASDEIFVENLGAISVVTTDALMPDGTGGLVFGAPAPAAHLLGGALHTADTLSNLNSKITDANLVDTDSIVLTSGANPLTGAWTFGDFDLLPTTTNTANLASGAVAMATVFVRTLQPDVGQSLLIREAGGAARMNFVSGGAVRVLNDVALSFGNSDEAQVRWDTFQTNPHLTLGVDSVTNVILITDQDRIGTLDLAIPAQTTPQLWLHDGSLTITNIGRVYQSTSQLRFESRAAAGSVETIVSGVFIWRVNPTGGTLQKIGGADPTDNLTGLDSRKLGFEARVWDGAAPQTRTGFIRVADASGTDDQISFMFSSDDNGGAENDFVQIRRDSAGNTIIEPIGGQLRLHNDTNLVVFFPATGSALRVISDGAVELGSSGEFRFEYETTTQTNNTLLLGTQGAEGNTVVFTDKARLTLDHVVGTPTTPTWRYHDGSATAGNWGSITHDGTNWVFTPNVGALLIDQNTNMRSLEIDSEATTQPVINLLSPANTSAPVFDIDDADALTTGGILNLKSNSASVGARALVRIVNDNPAAVGAVPLDIIQDAAKEAAALDLGTLDMGFINFKATADADAVSAISTLTTSGAVQGHVQMLVNGVSRWFAFLADPS